MLGLECCGGCCDVDACEEPRARTEHVPLAANSGDFSPTIPGINMNMFLNYSRSMNMVRAMDDEDVFTQVKLIVCCYIYTVLVVGLIGPTRDRMTAS